MMMIKRGRRQENPRHCLGSKARRSERDLVRGLHQGQRSNAPRKQAGHMTATRNDQHHPDLPLHLRGRPHMTLHSRPPTGD
jgi:hypothetical protein